MSNLISLNFPRRLSMAERQARLVPVFANRRRRHEDVLWLKENAELLNTFVTTGTKLPEAALSPYEQIYEGIWERLQFFPQYYRFLLSICLDLEALGYPGHVGEALCDWVWRRQLVGAELSDLQRLEAYRLLSRRIDIPEDQKLLRRVKCFMEQSETFALPNKKAAYELTHLVYYLSEYGQKKTELTAGALQSLEFVGILGYLDQDLDLLCSVSLAMYFSGHDISPIWENWIRDKLASFDLETAPKDACGDCYHAYLLANCWASLAGHKAYADLPVGEIQGFTHQRLDAGPLKTISEFMYNLGPARNSDWSSLFIALRSLLGVSGYEILQNAERSTPRFGDFFERFAREASDL